jgi:cytochrome c5
MRTFILIGLLVPMTAALADENQIHLKDAPGRDLVQSRCSICHSLDMIQINSPFLDKAGWDATVTKMIQVMGAPIDNAPDKAAIIDYLTAHYGKAP